MIGKEEQLIQPQVKLLLFYNPVSPVPTRRCAAHTQIVYLKKKAWTSA